MTAQAAFAATLVDEWARAGVTTAVVCPGSRSTPMALALERDERIEVLVRLDERSAAFTALGVGLATGIPAVVVTTSGTAAVELHPAVVEAHHAGVPLIAVTADRPPELHHVGAPQTVEQAGLFGGAVRWSAEPGVASERASHTWRSLGARAVLEALGAAGREPGPVHLDLAFVEPLAEIHSPGDVPAGRPGGEPWHRAVVTGRPPSDADVEVLGAGLRGVVVAGAGAGDPATVHAAAAALGWPVLADPTSGARLPRRTTVAAADALLRCERFAAEHRPEIVLRLGRPWASKVVGAWLAGLPADVTQVVVDPGGGWRDPDRTATHVSAADPTALCQAIATSLPPSAPGDWLDSWATAEAAAQDAFSSVLSRQEETTEPAVARALVDALPDGAALVVSSSMPVRDVEWYGPPREGLTVLSNRGANGIDGVVSTSIGVAIAQGRAAAAAGERRRATACLVGDIAFLHDVGALVGLAASGLDLVIVVVDNDGGGIFSFLPQASSLDRPTFERLFGTPHGADIPAIAAAHGVAVERIEAADRLGAAVRSAARSGGVRVIHVRTERGPNVAVHAELHDAVAEALDRTAG